MGQKPLRPCRKPGCPNLSQDGWCQAHRPPKAQKRQSAEWHWMYLTKTWTEELRPTQLLLEPFCRECSRHGRRVLATRVDHVVDHEGDWAKFREPKNLQSLCEGCHNRKTARTIAERRKKSKKF